MGENASAAKVLSHGFRATDACSALELTSGAASPLHAAGESTTGTMMDRVMGCLFSGARLRAPRSTDVGPG